MPEDKSVEKDHPSPSKISITHTTGVTTTINGSHTPMNNAKDSKAHFRDNPYLVSMIQILHPRNLSPLPLPCQSQYSMLPYLKKL